jgi:ribonuclease BN (tRNA processing enzyme)
MTMRLRVLGCSGGIGGRHLRTTSFLVDHDVLIDAGTGVGDLSLAELTQIDHIFVTHSHLDHVTSIPFLVDTVGGMRNRPLTIYASRATIEILRNHLFNWAIWPDFTEIPNAEAPFMRYQELELGSSVTLGGREFIPLPAIHTVPAVGYHLRSSSGSLVFSGDTGPNDELWTLVNAIHDLKVLVIETAFSNKERMLAEVSKHLCPSMLAEELAKLDLDPEVWITHLKPGEIELTMQEIEDVARRHRPRMLQNGQVFEF